MVSANMAFATVGTSTPTEWVRADARDPATRFGTYPSASIAASTRCRVGAATRAGRRTTRLTVMGDTPAYAATCARVGASSVSGENGVESSMPALSYHA